MSLPELLASVLSTPAAGAAAGAASVQLVHAFISTRRLRSIATDAATKAATAAVREHVRSCPGARILQPVAEEP